VGVYSGLQKIEANGKLQEAVRIQYKDGDLLYVNISSLHKIGKYSGKEGTVPKMNKLGSDVWNRLKDKTKKQVKDIATDLIKLYAQRKVSRAFRTVLIITYKRNWKHLLFMKIPPTRARLWRM
jgi:transcription-repair coupling factor (superfamily II helicase)